MSLYELVALFTTFNLLSFGNGPALLTMLQHHLVQETGTLTLDQFLYCYAIGRVTPGQANLYLAAVGYMLYGWVGALATVLVLQVPGYLVLPVVKGYQRFSEVQAVRGFIRGLTAASIGIICYVAFEIGSETLVTPIAVLVFLATLGLIILLRWSVLGGMLAAACGGLALKLLLAI
jgi:chromate transporter